MQEIMLRHIEEKEARILELTHESEAQITRAASQQVIGVLCDSY